LNVAHFQAFERTGRRLRTIGFDAALGRFVAYRVGDARRGGTPCPVRTNAMGTQRSATLAAATRPFRRFGVSSLARYGVLALGILSIVGLSEPQFANAGEPWLLACLWGCLAYFALDWLMRIRAAMRTERPGDYVFSAVGFIDAIAVLPVPIALASGVPPRTAWLLGVFWILKLAPLAPGFAQLRRVIELEAKPLTSVLVIFVTVLCMASVGMYVLERDGQPDVFGSLHGSLWWAVVTLTTAGYGDAVPQTYLGRVLAGLVMICGVCVFGLWTGILATGFAAEGRRRNFLQIWDLVSKVPFFKALDPSAIAEITHMLRRLDVPAGTTVIRRGRHGDCMYFIAEGEVEVEVAPSPVRLGQGTFFGELALLGDSMRTATVTTTQPSTLLMLDLADFRTLSAHHPEIARAIDSEAKRRSGENERLRESARPTPVSQAR
jgi:voltage-gated potassium channel